MTRSSLFLLPLLLALTLASAPPVRAQSAKELSVVRLYPAVGLGNYIALDGSRLGKHLSRSYGLFFDYAADPLVIEQPCDGLRNAVDCDEGSTSFLPRVALLHLNASVSIHRRVQIALDLPLGFTDAAPLFYQVDTQGGQTPSRQFGLGQGFGLADARLAVKTRILGEADAPYGLAVTLFSTLPTGLVTSHGDCKELGTCHFLGERGARAGGYLIAEALPRSNLRFAVNAGAAYRPEREFLTARVGSELLYGAAGHYAWTPYVHTTVELAGAHSLRGQDASPLEARGALGLGRDFVVKLGAGAGLIRDITSPAFRIFAAAQWTPTYRDVDGDGIEDRDDQCPQQPEDRDGFSDGDGCPDPDNDGDGVPDSEDECDSEPEDRDGFADDDGCPDPDNDGDGVPDGYDSCEGAKEDLDGDRDEDGCPDFDRDFDGVPDGEDACPDQPEDTDGLADEDGCPEADFDGDGLDDPVDGCPDAAESWNGILDSDGCPEEDRDADSVPDAVDRCPGQQETLNGKEDEDGCPDGASLITVSGTSLVPASPPRFEGTRLSGRHMILHAVATFLEQKHRRGAVRVLLVSPVVDSAAEARARALADALTQRTNLPVTAKVEQGTPLRLEFQLLQAGASGAAPQPSQ